MSEGLYLAGRGRRLVATLIDGCLVPSLTVVLVMVTDVVEDAEDYADNWWILSVFLLAVASYLLLNGLTLWRSGQTLGKKITGIAVVPALSGEDGSYGSAPAPLWKLILVRAWFFPLLFVLFLPPLSLLPILDQAPIFGKRRRCLHDLASGTVVVRLN